jgi:hypothetical protein
LEHKEYIIPLDNNEYYQGRVVVYENYQGFNADVLITNKESGKIQVAVKQLFAFHELEDLLRSAVQELANYLGRAIDKPEFKS